MTGDFVRDFAHGLTWLVQAYKVSGVLIGLIAGFFLVVSVSRYLEEVESWELFLVPFGLAVVLGPVLHFGVPWLVSDRIEKCKPLIGHITHVCYNENPDWPR